MNLQTITYQKIQSQSLHQEKHLIIMVLKDQQRNNLIININEILSTKMMIQKVQDQSQIYVLLIGMIYSQLQMTLKVLDQKLLNFKHHVNHLILSNHNINYLLIWPLNHINLNSLEMAIIFKIFKELNLNKHIRKSLQKIQNMKTYMDLIKSLNLFLKIKLNPSLLKILMITYYIKLLSTL
ncbi:unnamed protein product [Paramecium sonneborni]|uniref:Uncharacterized protein n=1 Tax=Paramecium sonneborni TaxID=65129 RepID=A0A8S1MZ24_9CILI|nr:unnamed protein product [Paramecium sonneborni]